jgi:Flp pilus assembly protein TadD
MKTTFLNITCINIIAFIGMFLLSGCATLRFPMPAIDSIDEFPVFIVKDGQGIDPASDFNAVPEVDILALSEDMKRVLDESVMGTKNQKDRLIALVRLIDQNIRYDVTEDSYATKTAIETYETKSGNCLSYSNLLVSMARYAGLKTRFEEIPSPPTWIRDGEIILFTRHIGASIDINAPGQNYYLLNIIGDSGNQRFEFPLADKVQYVVAPLLSPSFLQYTLNSLLTRPISDSRAFAQYYNNIGSKHLSEGNSADAFRYFVKAIRVDPEMSFVWSNLGVIYRWNNQPEAAEQAFLQALYVNGDKDKLASMSIMNNLASLYKIQGRTEEAGLYEEKVRYYRNRNPYYHYSVGVMAFDEGRYEQSVEHFNEAIKRGYNDNQFYYALALAYYRLGEMEKAGQNMNKAISYAKDRRIEEYYKQIWNKLTEG